MKNANKAKAKVQAKNQKGKDVKEDNQTSVLPNQELEKPVPDVKRGQWGDEEYAAGFAENKKRVARTPPETLKKIVRNLDEELNESKKLRDVGANPHVETREEINRRNIADVKDCMEVEETEENPNVITDDTAGAGEMNDGTTSSSSDGETSEEDSSSEEEIMNEEQYEELLNIQKQFQEMISTKTPIESTGLELIKRLLILPMSLDFLRGHRIAKTVNDFRRICRTEEIMSLGDTLMEAWTKLIRPDKETTHGENENGKSNDQTAETGEDNCKNDEQVTNVEEINIYVKAVERISQGSTRTVFTQR